MLRINEKSESLRGIFDRADIIVNQDFFKEEISKKHKSRSSRSVSSEGRYDRKKKRSPDVLPAKYEDSSGRSRDKYYRRSRSRSADEFSKDSPKYRRNKSRSPSYRKRSFSPTATSSKRYPHARVNRSRSYSPHSSPVKKPGLYIPPRSDYLRYEKLKNERASRSRSPVPSHSKILDKGKRCRTTSNERKKGKIPYEDQASTSKRRRRSSGNYGERRSRSKSPSDTHRERTNSRSPDRNRSPKRFEDQRDYKYRGSTKSHSRFRSPFRSRSPRRSRSPSRRNREYSHRRSRSHSRHRDRMREEDVHFQQNISPYIIKDGEYWIPAGPFPGPGYIPRGYLPPNMLYPRGFHPPMIMPRIPMMQPFRPRIYRPRVQTPSSNNAALATNDSQITQREEQEHSVEKRESEDNSNMLQPLIQESGRKESSVVISEICVEKGETKKDC